MTRQPIKQTLPKCRNCKTRFTPISGNRLQPYCLQDEECRNAARTAKEKNKKVKAPVRIKKLSDKRSKENTVYLLKRLIFLKENPVCQIKTTGCTGEATQVHHTKGRTGKVLTDERYFKSTCDNCHRYENEHPEWSKENGHSVSRLSK